MPDYRYEVHRGTEVIATGHMTCEQPLLVGEPITIGSHPGRVRSVDPILHERRMRLVIELPGGNKGAS
jgi:hypothetical protein